MLPKIRIIPKKISNKSCSENFLQFPFLYNLIFQPYHLLSSLAPLEGGIDIYPRGLFCLKFDAEKLLFEPFFGIAHIFSSIQPKSECILPFLYNFIFKPYHLSSRLAPLQGEIHICTRGLFCPKFEADKLLLEAFCYMWTYCTTCYHRGY